jgi:aldose 1-epimerase
MEPGSSQRPFGVTRNGEAVSCHTLVNARGTTAEILDYGATLKSLRVVDRRGDRANVVLGYGDLQGYEEGQAFHGAVVGRFANRIAGGRFVLDGETCLLACNNGPNHLHGGPRGFSRRVWRATPGQGGGASLTLTLLSPDGEEGYPGELSVIARYSLGEDDRLCLEFEASSDRATPINLTNHAYFNLAGDFGRDILAHELELAAGHFTPVDDTAIPTGEIRPVDGTPFDFRQAKAIGRDIGADDDQLRIGSGYDHNYLIDPTLNEGPGRIARVVEPDSGRVMTVYSTEPGVQLYTGNFLADGGGFPARHGFCLETQHFPDSPNQPNFPPVTLRPGQIFYSRTEWWFGTSSITSD